MSEKADVEKENTWLLYSDELEKRKVMLKLRALNNDPEHTTKVSYEYLLPVGHEESKMLRIPPEILEKYKDIRLLGTGGTSRVYSLTSKFTDSKVALKITPIINPYFRPLLHAFKISDHLRHFAIPRVLNYFSDDQAEYMIMDLIEGLDLYKLTSLGVLNLTEIIAIIAELCDVVDFLYLNNVIHRDIKPSNIMIGRSHSITLLDFDMATNTNEPFHDNVIMGTMRYAAPETFSPFYASVMSSEVFSIGATLYYCLRNEETRKYVKGHISGRALVDYINHYSGEEFGYGLEILKKEHFDLILMDHLMPEMDGIETLNYIRNSDDENTRKIPVIALTANAVSGMREMFLKSGFDDYVSKPIEIFALRRALENWLPEEKIIRERRDGND